MPRILGLLVAAVLVGAPLACGDAELPADASEEEIRAGKAESGYAAVGLLMFPSGGICSGTLIGPDLVLTAGHCVDEGNIPEGFYLGDGSPSLRATEATPNMRRIAVKAGEPVPGYFVAEGCPKPSLDVGLVKLEEAVEGVTPARLSRRVPVTDEECTAVGFGRHPLEDGGATRAEKRSAVVTFRTEMRGAFAFDDKTGGTEKGDSGGPLYCGRGIVGVNSCGNNPDRFARTDLALAWIEAKRKDWDAPWTGDAPGTLPDEDGGVDAGAPDARSER
jgi:hypothetical protein